MEIDEQLLGFCTFFNIRCSRNYGRRFRRKICKADFLHAVNNLAINWIEYFPHPFLSSSSLFITVWVESSEALSASGSRCVENNDLYVYIDCNSKFSELSVQGQASRGLSGHRLCMRIDSLYQHRSRLHATLLNSKANRVQRHCNPVPSSVNPIC